MTSSDDRTRTQTGRRPALDGTGVRVGIACGRFNDVITERLLEACRRTLLANGVAPSNIQEVWVPGAYELPLAARACATSGQFDAVITLGAVIRGDTPHFEYVAGESSAGLMRVQLDTGVPCVFGVLTTDTVEQAEARSGDDDENKGVDFAEAAIEMVGVLRSLR
jgi:6,7-dimethyl-8-ribityllumazine synthase